MLAQTLHGLDGVRPAVVDVPPEPRRTGRPARSDDKENRIAAVVPMRLLRAVRPWRVTGSAEAVPVQPVGDGGGEQVRLVLGRMVAGDLVVPLDM
jgi:hypothetical protein